MGEKTQENSQMGYSAAYPTGREHGTKHASLPGGGGTRVFSRFDNDG